MLPICYQDVRNAQLQGSYDDAQASDKSHCWQQNYHGRRLELLSMSSCDLRCRNDCCFCVFHIVAGALNRSNALTLSCALSLSLALTL